MSTGTWGGRRPGAGRKPKHGRPGVSHLRRQLVVARSPVLATLEVLPDLPPLDGARPARAVREALEAARQRAGFRVVEYALRAGTLELLIEADDSPSLARGMQSLSIRVARAVNGALGRRGRLWADRYQARVMEQPDDVAAAHRALRR